MIESLPFIQSELPIRKIFEIEGRDYEFEIRYSAESNLYTMAVRNMLGQLLYIAPLRYGSPWNSIPIEGFPSNVEIVPANLDDLNSIQSTTEINPENFGTKVELYVVRLQNVS